MSIATPAAPAPSAYLPPNPDPLDVIRVLDGKLRGQTLMLDRLDSYYRGTQRISFIHPDLAAQMGDRLQSLIVNWPRLIVDSLEDRLNVTGFRMPGEDRADAELWRIWQANDMDVWSPRVHRGKLKHGRAFVSVWANPADPKTPSVAFESARDVAVAWEPGTLTIRAALKRWDDGPDMWAQVYLPDRIVKFRKAKADEAWQQTVELPNPLGRVPLVPFVNRWDIDRPDGESEMTDALPLTDAVNKLMTDMMVTSEFHAEPRRWATGIELPNESESEAQRERANRYWEGATSGKTWLAGAGVQFGQFASADLRNFTHAADSLEMKLAAMFGLPPHYVGMITANPASADAIRSSESAFVRRAERQQVDLGESWEDVQELTLQVRDGRDHPAVESLETVWAEAATPTAAQLADAAVKLKSSGIIDDVAAQEWIGMSPAERQRISDRRDAAIAAQASPDVQERIGQALALVEQGVPAQVAFTALGLVAPTKQEKPGVGTMPPLSDDPSIEGPNAANV